jgi:hypothetical protein
VQQQVGSQQPRATHPAYVEFFIVLLPHSQVTTTAAKAGGFEACIYHKLFIHHSNAVFYCAAAAFLGDDHCC